MNEPVIEIAEELRTREALLEFKTASLETVSPDEVRFRVDPGLAFERSGRIARNPDGSVSLHLHQRYRPDEYMAQIAGTPLGGSLTEDLRSLIRHANWRERRPCWRETYRTQHPKWARVMPVTRPAVIDDAFRAVTEAAREKGIAHYLWRAGEGTIAYGNNPPLSTAVFSINPLGEWAFHVGPGTRPLETAPDLSALARERAERIRAVRLAAQDLGTDAVAAIRSGDQEAAPRDRPAPDRPARRR